MENKVVWVSSLFSYLGVLHQRGGHVVRQIATAEEANYGIFNDTVGKLSAGVTRHVQYKSAKYRVLETIADLQLQQG
jgi:hypothetical protein